MNQIEAKIESPSDYSLYGADIDCTIIDRVQCIETIKIYLNDTSFLYIDGPSGVGKTTILKLFSQEHRYNSISIFLNEDNHIVDKDIYKDLYLQSRIITGNSSSDDIEKDISLCDLIKEINTLQYFLKRTHKTIYFIFDGMNFINGIDSKFLSDLFLILPRLKNIKYLVSRNIFFNVTDIPVKNYSTYSVNILTKDEISLFLPSVDDRDLDKIINSFGGMPEKISTISRLMKKGISLDSILMNTSDECNTLYDTEWNVMIKEPIDIDIVGYICFSKNKLDTKSLSICLNIDECDTINKVNNISFIKIIDNQVDFVSPGFKNYCRKKLKHNKILYLDNLITLIKSKGETCNFGNIADYYMEKGDNKEILSHLNDDYLISTFTHSLSINDLHSNVNIALDASKSENVIDKIMKYAHLKCALINITTSPAIVSVLKCHLAENDLNSARELIGSANSNEEKLQLYCLYAIYEKEKGIILSDDIQENINFLYDKINVKNIGFEKAIDIAADLFPIFPEKAMKLINDLDELDSSGQNKSDHAFLKLSMISFSRHGDQFNEESDELSGIEDKRSSILDTVKIFNPDSPIEKINTYIDSLEEAGDKIFLLRSWLKKFYTKDFSIQLLDKILVLILETIDFSTDASLYSDITKPLYYVDKNSGNNAYKKIISQLDNIKKKGPTINYCQLIINVYKYELNNNIKSNRINELIDYILTLSDNSVSLSCLSIINNFSEEENIKIISENISTLKIDISNKLLNSDAYHVDVFKEAIKLEARYNLNGALNWARSLNSKPRRDHAHTIALKSYLKSRTSSSNNLTLSVVLEKLNNIEDETCKTSIYSLIISKFKLFSPSKNDLKKILKVVNRIENNIIKAKCYTNLIVKSKELNLIDKTSDNVTSKLKESYELVDGDWNKIKLAFYIHEKLNFIDKNLAKYFKEKAVNLCTETDITNKVASDYISTSLDLSIRAIYLLVKNNIDCSDDIDFLLTIFDYIPSNINKTRQLARLASAFQKNYQLPESKHVIEGHIIPILDSYSIQPSAEYVFCAKFSLPIICIYNFDIFTKYLNKLGNKNNTTKDKIFVDTINYIYNDCLINDPYKPLKDHKYNIGYSDITLILKLINLINDDSYCIVEIQKILDVTNNLRKSNKISTNQINDIIYTIKEKQYDSFPRADFIKHDGYKILIKALIKNFNNKFEDLSWEELINEARNIPNISDRAFSITEIASFIPIKDKKFKLELFAEAEALIDKLCSNLEKANRYRTLCENLRSTDNKKAKNVLKKALITCGMSDLKNDSTTKLDIIDMAHKFGDSFSGTLATIFDDDPARKQMIDDNIAKRKEEEEYKKKFEKNEDVDINDVNVSIPFLAWKQLGSLNANNCHCSKGFNISNFFSSSTELDSSDFYMLMSFYIHYLSIVYPGNSNTNKHIRPIFDSLIKNINIISRVYSNKIHMPKFDNIDNNEHMLVTYGENERDKAVKFLKSWFNDSNSTELVIIDPYFNIEDLKTIADVINRDPDVNIQVLTSLPARKGLLSNNDSELDEVIHNYWSEYISQSCPPSMEFCFAGVGTDDLNPIHDRWWFSGNNAVSIGTSISGIGKRISQITKLDLDETVKVKDQIEPILTRKQKLYRNEKIKYKLDSF